MFATLNIKIMMNNKSAEFTTNQQQIATFARTFSHPARVAIIQLLNVKNEIKASDISDYLPISRSTVSQHLKELQNAGIIRGNFDGLKIFYKIEMDKMEEIRSVLNTFFNNNINHSA